MINLLTHIISNDIDSQTIDYNIFLVFGQSNADQKIDKDNVNAPEWINDGIVDGVKVWNGSAITDLNLANIGQAGNGSGWIENGTPNAYCFDSIALKQYADNGGRPLLIKVSQGSTALHINIDTKGCWNVDFDNIDPTTPKLLLELKNRYDSCIAYLQANNLTYNVQGALFHQGEADRIQGAQYDTNLNNCFDYLRTNIKSDLPFVIGTISHDSVFYGALVETAHLNWASDPDGYTIDLSGATLFDTAHFDAISTNSFGSSVYNIIKDWK